jgi:hypothetical protein
VLSGEDEDRVTVILLSGREFTCGAKSTDFPLSKDGTVDKSISRCHALLSVVFDKQKSLLKISVSTNIFLKYISV